MCCGGLSIEEWVLGNASCKSYLNVVVIQGEGMQRKGAAPTWCCDELLLDTGSPMDL